MNEEIRQLALSMIADRKRSISIVRADAQRDANTVIKPPRVNGDVYLQDLTSKFFAQVQDEIPTTGRVIFRNVPLFAAPGWGKALAIDQGVLTPEGYVPIGDLRVGDMVIGSDGKPHKVTGVFPQGKKKVYRVTMTDGGSVECCDEHLWFTTTKEDLRAGRRGRVRELSEIRKTLTAKAYGHKSAKSGRRLVHRTPVAAPVEFAQGPPLPIDPYALGALLGDGDLTNKRVQLTNTEADVLERFRAALPKEDVVGVHPDERAQHVVTLTVKKANGLRGRPLGHSESSGHSSTKQAIDQLGLGGTDSHTKFIPKEYLFAGIEERWALLRGLMDTDGNVHENGTYVEFTTCSDKLRDDVTFLARSLGGIVRSKTRQTVYEYLSQKKTGSPSHRLKIRFPPNSPPPVASQKNLAKWLGCDRELGRPIESVEEIGVKECVCISVDADDKLFVTKDFLVTHNTVMAMSISMKLIEFYGSHNVSVTISPHLPSLVDSMRDSKKPVKILIVDDALIYYNSRSGGNKELNDAIGLFTTLRHHFQRAQNDVNGIVIVMFTTQGYKVTDKVFREGGTPIFKTVMVNDKQEIDQDYHFGKKTWEYLDQLYKDVEHRKKQERLSDAVVYLPGYGAGRLSVPMRDDHIVEQLLREVGTKAAMEAIKSPHVTARYKALERAWTVERRTMDEDARMRYHNQMQDRIAKEYAQQYDVDVNTTEGRAHVLEYLANRTFDLAVPIEKRISSEDYRALITATAVKTLIGKIGHARKDVAHEELRGMGFDTKEMTDGEVVDYACKFLLYERHIDPYDKDEMQTAVGHLWDLKPDHIAKRARDLKSHIKSRLLVLGSGRVGGTSQRRAKKDIAIEVEVEQVAEAMDLTGDYFDINPLERLDSLIAGAKARGDEKHARELTMYRAHEFGVEFGDRKFNTDTEIADTEAGKKWQETMFGKAYSRSEVTKNKSAGKRYYSNHIGLLFEAWAAQKLRDGYIVPGVFDKAPIREVINSGGNGHGPDITVVYQDGSKDYVSCKCYATNEVVSITVNDDNNEVKPEYDALRADERAGIRTNRLVVLFRNLRTPQLQVARRFITSADVLGKVGFNASMIGQAPMVKPGTVRDTGEVRASRPPLKLAT